ncbi:MAG: ATP-binding cassette domain-containing protein [Gammaproteobacteria bacterium]|nr:ATP-binding cassette domain-containing protein [Gammaproteobacteria bacterium]
MTATLALHNVRKRFDDVEVLKGISLTAHRGDVISLIGSSGSGKSTLLRCMNLLDIPDAGDIDLSGERINLRQSRDGKRVPVDQKQIDRARTRMGMVFQSFNLWDHMTLLENVMEAPVHVLKQAKRDAREKAQTLLAKVGLPDAAHRYPAQLSGGQQQRVAIARALAVEPEILLFDEPTSALDPELASSVLLVIQELAEEGRTMLLATHEMGFAKEVSSEVVFLHQGKIEEQGIPEQVFDDPVSQRCHTFLQAAR